MIRTGLAIASVLCWGVCAAAVSFDFGADLRIRQEIYDNAPCLPGGPGAAHGFLNDPGEKSGGYVNRIRFRPRVWGEAKVGEKLRVYTRLADEFRWNITPHSRSSVFPDEIFLDNLFVEAEGLLDGFLDFKVGRQDIDKLYGLDHLFQDGTASDGSRSLYADMAAFTLNFEDERKLDVFAIYQHDNNRLRWGNGLSENRSLTGTGLSGAESERDEWGGGAVWSAKFAEGLDYQIFAMHKNTASYRAKMVKRPSTRRELLGAKLMPRLTDEWSLQFEGMGQIGEDGEGETLYGWSSYAAAMWKSAGASRIKPFASAALHFMSGDKDSAETGGGWDPMWSRAVCYSEIYSVSAHYAKCWWSNMLYARLEGGIDFGRRHNLTVSSGPMFAAADDGMGGGDGSCKGLLSTARYSFPLRLADRGKGERFEMFGHLHAELFNPGDYFSTDRPGWFLRWQVEFKF